MTQTVPSAPAPVAGGWSMRVTVASVVVMAMLAVALVVVGLGWAGARTAMLDAASRSAQDVGTLTNERALRLMEPVQSTLRQLAFDPMVTAPTMQQRLTRLHVLTEELKANKLVAALYIAYPNGEFILTRRLDLPEVRTRFQTPDGVEVLVQLQTLGPDGQLAGSHLFYDGAGRQVQQRPEPGYRFDARTRPWFAAALKSTGPVLLPPYVFFSTQRVGVTLSQSAREGGAVVGIDVALDDLSELLGQLRMTPRSELALVNDQHEVLAHTPTCTACCMPVQTASFCSSAWLRSTSLP